MVSNKLTSTIFFIFCLLILESFGQKVTQRILEQRKMDDSEGEEVYNTHSISTTDSDIGVASQTSGTSDYANGNLTKYEPGEARKTLLGFGNFKEDNNRKIKFNIFIKKVKNANEYYGYIYFTIIFIKKKLRSLQDNPISEPIKGKLLDESYHNEVYDTYEVDITDTLDKYDLKLNGIDSITSNNDFCLSYNDDKYCEVKIYSNNDNVNIKDETSGADKFIFFNVKFKYINNETFYYDLYGNLSSSGNIDFEIKKGDIDIYYWEYGAETPYQDILSGSIEKSQNKTYQYKIRFFIQRSINTNLDGVQIDIAATSTTLRNLDSTKTKTIILSESGEESLSIVKNYQPSDPKYYTRKIGSGSGLSGGAIAGIIIASIIVLIAIAFTFIYLNKRHKPPISHSNAIEFYNSASSMQN